MRVPGRADDFWGWLLPRLAEEHGLTLRLEFSGAVEGLGADLLLADAARGALPDLALLSPAEVDAIRVFGLLTNSDRAAESRPWPAGLVVPLVLARVDLDLGWREPLTWELVSGPSASAAAALDTQPELAWLDPGRFDTTVHWLRLRAGLRSLEPTGAPPAGWEPLLQTVAALHQAPQATRFWEKRWAEATRTFRRGRAAVAVADTEALRQTREGLPRARGFRVPPIGAPTDPYPVRVPAWWVSLRPAASPAARAFREALNAPETLARIARFHGWAPRDPAAWAHPAMRQVLADVPAWRTVRDILELENPKPVWETPQDARADVASTAAVGLWLAGLRDAEAAWSWAMANASPETARARATETPYAQADTDAPVSLRSPPLTVTQGEWVFLPLEGPLGDGATPRNPTAAAANWRVILENQSERYETGASVLRLRAGTDALEPVSPHEPADGERTFVEFQAPTDARPGAYTVFLTAADTKADRRGLAKVGPLRVTAVDLASVRVPAVCGIGESAPASYVVAIRALLCRHGFVPFPLPWSDLESRCEPDDPLIVRRWHDPTQAEADAAMANECGLLGSLVEYSYDEPTLLHFPHIIREGPRYARLGIRVLVTHPPTPLLEDRVDMWGVHASLRPTDTPSTVHGWRDTLSAIARARARGQDVWWYTAGDVAPLPNLQLDADLMALRAAFFRLPALGFSGVLQADAAAWPANPSAAGPVRTSLGVGEGLLCYPGATPGTVLASRRLKELREGLHTLRLVEGLRAALHRRVAALPDAPSWAAYPAERLAAYGRGAGDPRLLGLDAVLHPFVGLTTSDAHLQEAGASLRDELHACLQGPAIVLRGDAPDWSAVQSDTLTLTGYVEPGAGLRIAGAPRPVGPDGHFTWTGDLAHGANVIAVEARRGSRRSTLRWHVWRRREPLSVSDAYVTMPRLGAE